MPPSLPDDLLARPAHDAVRRIALAFLDDAVAAHVRLAAGDDAEALHDFRVALRRLRSTFRAYAAELEGSIGKRTRRRLARLAAASGESRDIEVHLLWLRGQGDALTPRQRVGLQWLIARLEARKAVADHALWEEVARDFAPLEAKLRRRLTTYRTTVRLDGPTSAPTLGTVAARLLLELTDELARHLAAVHAIADQEEAHEARIAGKRVRYLLEPLARLQEGGREAVAALKVLQEILGDMHDAHVFSAEIVAASSDAAAEQARRVSTAVLEGDAEGAGARREQRRDPRTGLLTLARRLRARGDEAFAALDARWLRGPGTAALLAQLRALGAALAERARAGTEIERKYLLSALPPAARDGAARVDEIHQGWVPGDRLAERLRRVRPAANGAGAGDAAAERLYRTVKLGSGLTRIEVEEETTPKVFAAMWPLTARRRVRKRRYRVPAGPEPAALVWEIDEFLDRGLVLAEVELPSEDTPVPVPDWLAPFLVREVTGEAEYVNLNLAK